MSDVVPAAELVDVSGGNLSTNDVVIIDDMANIGNLLPHGMALAALELTFSENKKDCFESCYGLGYHLSDLSYTQYKQLKDTFPKASLFFNLLDSELHGTLYPLAI